MYRVISVYMYARLFVYVCVCVILMSIMLEFAKSFTVERECSLPASSSKFTAFQLWSRLLPFLFIILSRVVFVAYAPKHQHTTHYIYTIGFTPVTSLSQRARRLFFSLSLSLSLSLSRSRSSFYIRHVLFSSSSSLSTVENRFSLLHKQTASQFRDGCEKYAVIYISNYVHACLRLDVSA